MRTASSFTDPEQTSEAQVSTKLISDVYQVNRLSIEQWTDRIGQDHVS